MKRLHLHVAVSDLTESTSFYSTLFGCAPTVLESDYAKWMLEDPRVNFAISKRDRAPGLDHLGIQVESRAELGEVADRLAAAGRPITEQKDAACCYATSDKAWVADPQGIAWETFFTFGRSTVYGEDTVEVGALASASACCAQQACGAPERLPTPAQAATAPGCCGTATA